MKKVIAVVGCANMRNTHRAVLRFLDHLQALGETECEIVSLGDYSLKPCRGCRLCFDKGEEFCPLHDDRDLIFRKIEEADGIVLATPNYSFQISGMTKVLLDRLGFAFHRPRYFGKAFTSIVCQGFFGGGKILARLARRFHERLAKPALPAPGWIRLFLFRWSRTSIQRMRGVSGRDYAYYADQGWFESAYFYPVRLGGLKSAAGKLFDSVAGRLARSSAA
jgi:NAD(P)H-dependent FMN reductase